MTDPLNGARWVLHHGDSLEVIPTIGAVDALVSDPPYGVNYSGSVTKHGANGSAYSFEDEPGLVRSVYAPIIKLALSKATRGVITPGRANAFEYERPAALGAIFYPSGANTGPWGFVASQPLFFYGKCPFLASGRGRRPDSFSSTEATDRSVDHPCPKPLGVMLWLVARVTDPDDIVLDPFAGSGTTGVACLRLGRRFIGIEKDERYAAIATERLKAEERGLSLREARAGQTTFADLLRAK